MEPDRPENFTRARAHPGRAGSLRSARGRRQPPASTSTRRPGIQLFETERDQSLIERLEHDLDAIARAERRLEEGTYGVSVESGEPIPEGRLEAVPWAERTADEQSRYEAGT
jgi:DnaK suppressor protein